MEVGGFGAGLAGRGRDSIRDWSLEGVRILLGGLAAGTLSPETEDLGVHSDTKTVILTRE